MPNLIPINLTVNLAHLYEYDLLARKVDAARQQYYKLYNSSMKLVSSYLDEMPEAKTIIRLRREIRLATRGTPATIAQDAITSAGYITTGTEQLYNAQAHLVKNAYRMVAPLVHPDRGGDSELFQLVVAAYRLGDLTFLQETYLMLVKNTGAGKWAWRCHQGREYMKQELQRPQVSLQRLRNDPTFQIAMLHQQGKPAEVIRAYAEKHAQTLIFILQSELNHLTISHLTEQHHGNSQESSNKENSGEENSQWEVGDFEQQEGRTERQSVDSAGESATGTCQGRSREEDESEG